ncbi:MAG: hypothetical protein LBU43_02785 [Candidatus Accumulibacter sp.]|jgi:hypothetical protein|nr:hypothetical protein [Accumulibacter sp.]
MNAALSLLDRIGEGHRRMASLADVLDWDGVADEWHGIYPNIVKLREITLDHLTDQERVQAAKQMTELIGFEKRISARIAPWMEQVQPMLEVFRKHPLDGESA